MKAVGSTMPIHLICSRTSSVVAVSYFTSSVKPSPTLSTDPGQQTRRGPTSVSEMEVSLADM